MRLFLSPPSLTNIKNMPRNDKAFQIMNICRRVAVMNQQDWLHHYRYRLRSSDRKMLATIRYITNSPITCTFPWDPTTNPVIPVQEQSPPLTNAPNPLEHPVQGDESDEDMAEESPVRRTRRRSAGSDEEYQGQRENAQANQAAISRTSKKEFINVLDEEIIPGTDSDDEDIFETNFTKMNRNKYMTDRLEDPSEKKRHDSLGVLSKIVQGCNDEYCLGHTGLKRNQFLEYLKIEDGIPRGFEVDHIRPRKEFKTDQEFKLINHYKNLKHNEEF
jgi:hypothetical protein